MVLQSCNFMAEKKGKSGDAFFPFSAIFQHPFSCVSFCFEKKKIGSNLKGEALMTSQKQKKEQLGSESFFFVCVFIFR